MPSLPWKTILNYAGFCIGMIGILFIIQRLYLHFDQLKLLKFDFYIWSCLSALVIIYGFSNQLLSISWWRILHFLEVDSDKKTAIRIYTMSLLGKYVPGNIFQFAGRQALGLAAGYSGKVLLKSTFLELGIISIIGVLYGVIAISQLYFPSLGNLTIIVFLIVMLCFSLTLKIFISQELGRVFLLHLLFLGVSGFVFVGIIGLISPELFQQFHILTIGSVYIFAWLIGLITPGAPAGLGVRELVLVGLLGNTDNEASIVYAAMIGRIITILGDLVYFAFSNIYYRKKNTI